MSHFAKLSTRAIPITPLNNKTLVGWLKKQKQKVQRWIKSTNFKASPGETCLIADEKGNLNEVLVGVSENADLWDCGDLSNQLPEGIYKFKHSNAKDIETWALGWALGSYSYDHYQKNKSTKKTRVVLPRNSDLETMVEAVFLTRDLINTPANDMGPIHLEKAARTLAKKHKAKFRVILGDNLLKKNYPSIHAIGRAVKTNDQAPRLIDLRWGKINNPQLTLIGKGVCFDTGGLNLKAAEGMKLMKKDMGGAANVLGLAHMIMAAKLPLQLRVLIPAVENSVSGNALRPLDIITSRNGKTIEIGNTDAEGRVILADALAEASSEKPAFIIDFATLTRAAIIALGAELPAFFTNDEAFAKTVSKTGVIHQDPLWRLPLWSGYQKMVKGKTANLTNAPESGFAGAITAALFLQEFIEPETRWAHIDLMAWNLSSKPGRPEGGEAMAIRSVFATIKEILL